MSSNAICQIQDIMTDDKNQTKFDTMSMLFDGTVSAIAASKGRDGAEYGNTAGIDAAWNQLFKKGLFDPNARKYFYKTAHNSDKKFVLASLLNSSKINAIGSAIITAKNWVRGRFQ